MSVPRPRLGRPDDEADVLAEIRRLVSRGAMAPQPDGPPLAATARVAAGMGDDRQSGASQSLLQPAAPLIAGAGHSAPQDDGAAVARLVGHAGRPHAMPRELLFRLNPDALIPPAEFAEEHSAMRGQEMGAAVMPVCAPAPATPFPDRQPAAPLRSSGPPCTVSLEKEPAMPAHANSPVNPLHAASMPFASECPASGPADSLQGDAEIPLRALLRQVVREELEGELQRQLDDSLRRMVRHEIAAALTEALMRRPQG